MTALVQTSGTKIVAASAGPETFTMPGNFTAGNSAVVTLSHFLTAGTAVTSVTIGGTAATRDLQYDFGGGTQEIEVWKADNIAGGTPNFVVTYGGGTLNYLDCGCEEWDATLAIDSGTNTSASDTFSFNSVSNLTLFSNTTNQYFTFNGTTGTLGTVSLNGIIYLTRVGTFTITVYQNAIELYSETFDSNTDNQIFTIDWLMSTSLTNGDVISVQGSFTASEEYVYLSPNLTLQFISDYPQASPAAYGVTLQMKNLLPKGIQQKDFFASICRMFNLYVYEDANKIKHLLIISIKPVIWVLLMQKYTLPNMTLVNFTADTEILSKPKKAESFPSFII